MVLLFGHANGPSDSMNDTKIANLLSGYESRKDKFALLNYLDNHSQ